MTHVAYAPSENSLAGRIVATFAALPKRAQRYAAYRRNLSQLNALSDATLRDLGLERSALPAVARKAAFEN